VLRQNCASLRSAQDVKIDLEMRGLLVEKIESNLHKTYSTVEDDEIERGKLLYR